MDTVDVDDREVVDEPDDAEVRDDVDEPNDVEVSDDVEVRYDADEFDGPDELDGPDGPDELDGPDEFEETGEVEGADESVGPAEIGGLSERERQVLAFERQWWKHAGSKEQAIRDQFGVSSTRYYQLLNGLLDDPAALAHDPVLVKRLRRLRATRTRARSGGRVA
jgi:hypothetical protein